MIINRILVLMTTANIEDAGTNSFVELSITTIDGQSNGIYTIAGQHTSPADLERGEADFFFLQVFAPFTRRDLRSITLRIRGDDMWIPQNFFVFGLDDASGRPESIVPLLNESVLPPNLFTLSTDSSEGVPAVEFDSIQN